MTTLLADPGIRDAVVPISVEQYHQMGAAGIIDSQTELLCGVMVKKMIKSPLHTLTVKRLVGSILNQLPEGYELRKEEPLACVLSEPEPDIAVVLTNSYDPTTSHPSSALLVVEVAISSEAIDRAKAIIYASTSVPEYWLVLPEKHLVERFTDPGVNGYGRCDSFRFDTQLKSLEPLNLLIDLRCDPGKTER